MKIGKEYTINYPKVYPPVKVTLLSIEGDKAKVRAFGGVLEIDKDKLK